MIVAIPIGAKHVPQAIKLLNWMAELDGGSRHPCLLVIAREISYDTLQELLKAAGRVFCNISTIKTVFKDKQRQSDADNLLFRAACEYTGKVTRQPFFWLGLDSVPVNAGWLDKIELDNPSVKPPAKDALLKDYPLRSVAFPESVFAKDAGAIDRLRGSRSVVAYDVLRPDWPEIQRLAHKPRREPSITLIYIHVPGDQKHWRYLREFVESYQKFPPEYDHQTVVVCQGKPAIPLARGLFKALPNLKYFQHDDSGWDIGGYIAASQTIESDCVVCLGGSAYFQRAGWLKRISEAWQKHGAGFYGATSTYEVSPHLCTSGFWCSPEVLKAYPIKVVNRETRYDFEHGPNACWKMVAHNGLPAKLVTWDGEYDWQDWRKPPNIYRRGDQSNSLLCWHHYREYEKADAKLKESLSTAADTLTDRDLKIQPPKPSLMQRASDIVSGVVNQLTKGSGPSIAIAYLYPCDARETFVQFAQRWSESYKRFAPVIKHEVIVSMSNGTPNDADFAVFDGIPATFNTDYDGGGWDIGNFQHIAKSFDHDLIVFMNSRAFFWRGDWLERFVEAFEKFGPKGLYGVMASFESCPIAGTFPEPNPHIRTSCFVTNPKVLRQFPHVVDSREQSFKFESGEWNVSEWYAKQGYPVKLVTADGFYDRHEWRKPADIFRRGDQSNCLIADRHTLLYANASDAEKTRLSEAANGGKGVVSIPARPAKTITVVAATSLNAAGHAKAIDLTVAAIPQPCERLLIANDRVAWFSGKQMSLPEPWAKNGKWTLDDMCDFLLTGLHEHITTDFAIIVHNDGYALNKAKWTNDFLSYDYIGAPWPSHFPWTKPNCRVGNGGFSLRSKRWLQHAAKLLKIPSGTSEDVYCGVHNVSHFLRAGFKIAPIALAMRWSFEHPIEEFPNWHLRDSFGWHGRKTEKDRKHMVLT